MNTPVPILEGDGLTISFTNVTYNTSGNLLVFELEITVSSDIQLDTATLATLLTLGVDGTAIFADTTPSVLVNTGAVWRAFWMFPVEPLPGQFRLELRDASGVSSFRDFVTILDSTALTPIQFDFVPPSTTPIFGRITNIERGSIPFETWLIPLPNCLGAFDLDFRRTLTHSILREIQFITEVNENWIVPLTAFLQNEYDVLTTPNATASVEVQFVGIHDTLTTYPIEWNGLYQHHRIEIIQNGTITRVEFTVTEGLSGEIGEVTRSEC